MRRGGGGRGGHVGFGELGEQRCDLGLLLRAHQRADLVCAAGGVVGETGGEDVEGGRAPPVFVFVFGVQTRV